MSTEDKEIENTESSSEDSQALVSTLNKIFSKQEHLLEKRTSFKSHTDVPIQDLEVALTVLLVDLASCDQEFDKLG